MALPLWRGAPRLNPCGHLCWFGVPRGASKVSCSNESHGLTQPGAPRSNAEPGRPVQALSVERIRAVTVGEALISNHNWVWLSLRQTSRASALKPPGLLKV